jgi:hypothetical protein
MDDGRLFKGGKHFPTRGDIQLTESWLERIHESIVAKIIKGYENFLMTGSYPTLW